MDSAGPGKYRGGCGLRKDIELRTDSATLNLLGDRHKFEPYGLNGGGSGKVAETVLNPEGDLEEMSSKERRELKRGDVVSVRLAGAGGFGPVEERDPAAIERDISEGFVTVEAAREVYGWSPSP